MKRRLDKPHTSGSDRQAFLRKEAAKMLGVSEGLIIKLGRLGKIRTISIGRRRLVPRCEIERILREGIP